MIFKHKNYSNCIPKLLLKNWLFLHSVSPLVLAVTQCLFSQLLKAQLKLSAMKMEHAINRASYGYEMIAKTPIRTTICSFFNVLHLHTFHCSLTTKQLHRPGFSARNLYGVLVKYRLNEVTLLIA